MLNNKKLHIFFIILIFILAIFLRSYNFSDWLHFELDQSRDAKVIDLALENGPQYLPLLGPKAAGSFLRLGPIFYYFKYISGLLFGNTPSGIAVIILIFGILAVPVAYLLLRRYFNKWISLSILSLFTTSLFLIMYSRFSWNPNALPFFTILTAYAVLRAVDQEEKNSGIWLLVASAGLSVSIQLHFLAFVSVPVITFIFLAIKRPKIRWVYWLGAIGIIIFFNLPVLINEVKTGGGNIKEFQEVVRGKSNKDGQKNLIEKVVRNYSEDAKNYWLILSSKNSEIPTLDLNPKADIKCDQKCRDGLFLVILSFVFVSAGLILLFRNFCTEKGNRKKDFLTLLSIWFVVCFVLFIPLAYDISPRFWLIVAFLPFIFLGFILDFFRKLLPRQFSIPLIAIITLILLGSNLQEDYLRFNELAKAKSKPVIVSADRILKEKTRVTLDQQYDIINYIISLQKQNNYPVYLNSDPQYRRSFMFHLDQRSIPRDDIRNISISKKIYANGNYFLIYPTLSDWQKDLDKYSESYSLVDKKEFGTLTVFRISPKPEAVTDTQQVIEPRKKSESAPGVPERFTWEEIFSEDSEKSE